MEHLPPLEPEPELQSGEVRFDLAPQPLSRFGRWQASFARVRKSRWSGPLFAVAVAAAIYLLASRAPATATVSVPAAPTPPGRYAVLASSEPVADHSGIERTSYVGFIHERLEIIVVPPAEIPEEDRKRAEDVRGTPGSQPRKVLEDIGALAPLLKLASHFAAPHPPALARAAVEGGVYLDPRVVRDPPPYILHGAVNIRMGDLRGGDQGFAAMMLNDGSLSRASIHLMEGESRGPPVRTRRVYVMGGPVGEVNGPEQHGRSKLTASLLDLGPTPESVEAYGVELAKWKQDVAKLERDMKLEEGSLLDYGGETVTAENGRVVSARDAEGRERQIPHEEETRHERVAEPLEERPMEFHPR